MRFSIVAADADCSAVTVSGTAGQSGIEPRNMIQAVTESAGMRPRIGFWMTLATAAQSAAPVIISAFGSSLKPSGLAAAMRPSIDWLRELGVNVVDLHSQACMDLLGDFIARQPAVWNEDIGED